MGVKNTVSYVCDGCGSAEEARKGMRDGWTFFYTSSEPGTARLTGPLAACPDCSAKVKAVIKTEKP